MTVLENNLAATTTVVASIAYRHESSTSCESDRIFKFLSNAGFESAPLSVMF